MRSLIKWSWDGQWTRTFPRWGAFPTMRAPHEQGMGTGLVAVARVRGMLTNGTPTGSEWLDRTRKKIRRMSRHRNNAYGRGSRHRLPLCRVHAIHSCQRRFCQCLPIVLCATDTLPHRLLDHDCSRGRRALLCTPHTVILPLGRTAQAPLTPDELRDVRAYRASLVLRASSLAVSSSLVAASTLALVHRTALSRLENDLRDATGWSISPRASGPRRTFRWLRSTSRET